MLTRTLCMLLTIILVAGAGLSPVLAKSKEEKRAEFAAKVQNEIAKLGVGTDTRVEVKLRDKTKLKGYISAVDEEGFTVTDSKTAKATSVTYNR